MQEKGVGFQPGGEVPDSVRTTAWSPMGQAISPNYGKLVFGLPSSTREDLTALLSQPMDFYQEAPTTGRNLKKKMNP